MAEEDTVRVDDPDVAVRLDDSIDERSAAAGDAVERDRAAIRLLEDDARSVRDREARELVDRLFGRLMDDGRRRVRRRDRRAAGYGSEPGQASGRCRGERADSNEATGRKQ